MILQSKNRVSKLQENGIEIVNTYLNTPLESRGVNDTMKLFSYLKKLFSNVLIGSLAFNNFVFLANDILNKPDKIKFFTEKHTKKEIQTFLENY